MQAWMLKVVLELLDDVAARAVGGGTGLKLVHLVYVRANVRVSLLIHALAIATPQPIQLSLKADAPLFTSTSNASAMH